MQEGQSDPGLYDFAPWRGRPKIVWPQGKTVAVWVAPNLDFYELDPPANPLRKSWAKPHPDVVGYSHRAHANRVSHWRIADVMTRHGLPVSVSLPGALFAPIPAWAADAPQPGR